MQMTSWLLNNFTGCFPLQRKKEFYYLIACFEWRPLPIARRFRVSPDFVSPMFVYPILNLASVGHEIMNARPRELFDSVRPKINSIFCFEINVSDCLSAEVKRITVPIGRVCFCVYAQFIMTWVACAQFSRSRQHSSHPLRLAFFFTRRVHQKFKHSHVHRRFCVALFAESDVWQWFIDSQPTCKRKYVRVPERMTYAHAYLAECWFACSGLGKYNVNDLLTRLICVSCSRSPFVFPFILPSINSGTNFMQRRSLILLNPQCPCPWPLLKNCFLCFQQKEN